MTLNEKTNKNVIAAFVGEARAAQRLKLYAERAEKEELPGIARLFRAVAAAEGVHARRHFMLLERVKDTQSNLEQAFESEMAVNDNVYPAMIRDAEEEGEKAAALVFSQARDVEEVHAKLYKNALNRLMADEADDDHHYCVCTVCGYIHELKPEEPCPVCNAPVDKFVEVP